MNFNPSRFNQTKNGFTDSKGSFPIGEGDCGANVWVSDDGKLNLLLSKTDTFSEASRLMKLGYLKIGFSRPVFSENNPPSATLHLEEGTVVITDAENTVKITVAAFIDRCLYGVDFAFGAPAGVSVSLFNYRSEKRRLSKKDDSARSYAPAPFDVYESADRINTENSSCLSWYHHNEWSYYESTLKNQHLTEITRPDPILNRTFGCSVAGEGFSLCGKELRSGEERSHTIYVSAGCEMTETPDEWSVTQGKLLVESLGHFNFEKLKNETAEWWHTYFGQYYLEFSGDEDAEAVTRGYTLQKYILGCCSRGKKPVKFNGAIFTVEPSPHYENDYDYRLWGDAYWIQNTRLIYWNLLYSGYYEGILPYFDLVTDIIPECRERCRVLFGHEGILLPETFSFFGTYEDVDFGYGQENSDSPACQNNYIRWHYNGALETAYMMLKFREFAGPEYAGYFETKLLPFIQGVLQFFKEHFPKKDGKMYIHPVSSLETWQDCTDDTPDIAGLLAVVRELKRIGADPVIDETDIPDFPLGEKEGKTVIRPCDVTFRPEQQNCENPELYPLFPFDVFRCNMDEKDRKLLSDTFELVPNKHVRGWSQMNIWAAMLGDAEYCRKNVADNFRAVNKDYFFGAYFGPNFDWTPDQDHGCSTSIAAIYMALQSFHGEVSVNPALPEGWKVRFRLPSSCGVQEFEG